MWKCVQQSKAPSSNNINNPAGYRRAAERSVVSPTARDEGAAHRAARARLGALRARHTAYTARCHLPYQVAFTLYLLCLFC